MMKVLKDTTETNNFTTFLLALIESDFKTHMHEIISSKDPGEIAKKAQTIISFLIKTRDLYIKIDDSIINEMIGGGFLSEDEAKGLFEKYTEDIEGDKAERATWSILLNL